MLNLHIPGDDIKCDPERENCAVLTIAARTANSIHIRVTFHVVTRYVAHKEEAYIYVYLRITQQSWTSSMEGAKPWQSRRVSSPPRPSPSVTPPLATISALANRLTTTRHEICTKYPAQVTQGKGCSAIKTSYKTWAAGCIASCFSYAIRS